MNTSSIKQEKRTRRHARIRAKVKGTAERPRLAVYRSNTAVYAQLIDDARGVTLVAKDSRSIAGASTHERAHAVGVALAESAKALGITTAVFDRGGFLYAGAVQNIAEGAREGGLLF
ncbi:MAG: 50S ribosomal protein L18 [Candidatus Pacebacteria bacterium]|nr:50S ribosomal protein L18 [Candidatus Paceibacterota bacterium]